MLTLRLVGGISYFAPREGWACDNVVNFEVGSYCASPIQRNAELGIVARSGIRHHRQCQRNGPIGPLACP